MPEQHSVMPVNSTNPELNSTQPTLTVTEDNAIDKDIQSDEIVVEEPMTQLEEVKPSINEHDDEIAIVNLDEPFPGFKPLSEPREDNADDELAPVVVVEEEPVKAGPITESELKVYDLKPTDKIVVDEDLVPGSEAKFVEDKAEDKPVAPETDWAKDGDHSKFIAYITTKKNSIPKHSGETVPGCERALHYLKSLNLEISKAMRTDLKGLIDEQQVDALRKEIESMVERLDKQINKLQSKKRKAEMEVRIISQGQCDKCNCETPMWEDVANKRLVCLSCNNEIDAGSGCVGCDEGLEKEANTAVVNMYITPFERAIISTVINSVVSGGKQINEVFERLNKKYAFTDREKLAFVSLLSDYGYPVFVDRGRVGDKNQDPSDSNESCDFLTQYYA